jgi:hypothetical protein
VLGSLVLGGYDRSRSSLPTLQIPSTSDTIVGVQRIGMTTADGISTTLLSTGILATIDTNVPEIWLPSPVCDAFASALGLTYDSVSDRYTLSPTAHSVLSTSPPTFTFTLGTSIRDGSTIDINLPYAAFDLQATYPIFPNATRYFPLRRAGNESQYALGRAFMQEIYLTVDWERDVFNISQAVFNSPMPKSDVVRIEPKNRTNLLVMETHKSKLSAGAIAGIAVGALLLVILGVTAWWIWRQRSGKADTGTSHDVVSAEKGDTAEFAPEAVGGGLSGKNPIVRTDFELEGRLVPEMYAPFPAQKHEQQVAEMQGDHERAVEAEGSAPVYELAVTTKSSRGT